MQNSDDERPTDAHAIAGDELDADGDTVTSVDNHLAPGTDVGGYVIDGELGTGGMGVVYAATHPVIGKRAAIKVLRPELSKHPAAVERFVLEARAVNQIGHPNIVDIFAFGALPDGRSYYVMDLLVGESLRRRLRRGGPLHVSEAASVIDELASALLAAHDKGIIHRDLKPDNVFMVSVPGRWPEVRILDWGLLKLTSARGNVAASKYRTLAGSVMGTPVYMSPEQARASDSVDLRTDIYSLGVVAFEILSGEVPFKKGSSIDTLLAHQDEPIPSLAQKCPALPEELVQLIEAMLAKEPEGRPTLAAVRAVIKRLKGSKIPTMTAAGLSMPPGPGTPFVDPPADSPPAHDVQRASMELTTPLARGSGLGPDGRAARGSDPESAFPLPPPPPGVGVPPPAGQEPQLQSLPYQSMTISQSTLAGHSMPMRSSSPAISTTPIPGSMPPANPPYGSLPPANQPYGSQGPHSSMPPQHSSMPSMPPHPSMASMPPHRHSQPSLAPPPARASNLRRILVIAAAAIIASALGILIVSMT